MIKNILQDIYRVDVWPAFSLILFMVFFVAMLAWTFSRRAGYVDAMRSLPLDEDTPSTGETP